ncbi:unnamed protein product [Caenorhabditis auriculariae]|uniref:Uncharacterized protein n=1 Tax=Caenorhabditis auriculariae TaxID=2777116 RepID=A0A8S1HCF9_9PELO|nr:unnamed protein product [Caenorhabditis auriculariae]
MEEVPRNQKIFFLRFQKMFRAIFLAVMVLIAFVSAGGDSYASGGHREKRLSPDHERAPRGYHDGHHGGYHGGDHGGHHGGFHGGYHGGHH